MNYGVYEILKLIGSLGLFLYGMKLMSEALQKVAGDKMRNVLGKMTANRVKGVFTGLFVTSVVQSSSATTVMLVSFVNAGLISLVGAIGIIMGANIGTTVTGWLVSALGFKVSVAAYALPLIGLALPLMFARKSRNKSLGELIIGFALLFIGLDYMKNSVPDLKINQDFGTIAPEVFEMSPEELSTRLEYFKENKAYVVDKLHFVYPELAEDSPEFKDIVKKLYKQVDEGSAMISDKIAVMNYISGFKGGGFGSILLFLLFGTILTFIIQSSSATMALTIVMSYNGIIPFELAAAMILGENIGTTITANIAALVANTTAKRAARAHFFFNIIGVIWVLIIFYWFLGLMDWLMIHVFNQTSAFNDPRSTPFALSLFHSLFNITNTLLLVGFVPLLAKLVEKVVPAKDEIDEEFRLKFIGMGMVNTAELSIVQASKEIVIFSERALKTFGYVKEMFNETNDKNRNKLFNKIKKYEDILDRMEVEVANYLTKVSEGELTERSSKRIRAMLKLISDIESIGDSCYNMAIIMDRKREKKVWFEQDQRDKLNEMFVLVDATLNMMHKNLSNNYDDVDIDKANELESEVNRFRDLLRAEYAEDIRNETYSVQTGIYYKDLFSESEKLSDFVINVSEALDESNSLK